MKLTLDLENLESLLRGSLDENLNNLITTAIKETVYGEINLQVKSLVETTVNEKIVSYVDDYITKTKIKIGWGYFDKIPEENLTVEEYIKRQISTLMESNTFKIITKDRWGDKRTETVDYATYINSKFDISDEVEKALSNFMTKVKNEVSNKITEQFNEVTKQMISDTMLQLLAQNDTFTKIQQNIACIAAKG